MVASSRSLSPEQATAYVRELSADVRAVVVLGPDGALLAGPPALAAAAQALATATGDAGALREAVWRSEDAVAFAARAGRHAVVAVAGPLSLSGPTALDVRAAVLALEGAPEPAGPDAPAPPPRTPDSAAQRAIRALMTAV